MTAVASPSTKGRKSPVVLLKWKRPVDARQVIWDAITRNEVFSVTSLSRDNHIHLNTVATYLSCLVEGGFIARREVQALPNPPNFRIDYQLLKNAGIHAPRLRLDGAPVEQGKGRAAAWRTMRVLKQFTTRDIHLASGAAECDVKTFAYYLTLAGYLRIIVKGKSGTPAVYKLVHNSGPKPPQVTRVKCIYDPNLNKVTWPTAEIEAEHTIEGAP